jgi:hypothetical protein
LYLALYFDRKLPIGEGMSIGFDINAIKNLIQTGSSLQFKAVIDLNTIDSQVIYPYCFDLIASDLNTPDWWQTWDWNKRSNNEDGSKTYQLLRFMESLQTATLKALPKDSTIDSLCFAVQKN